jgi:hypothetical protein
MNRSRDATSPVAVVVLCGLLFVAWSCTASDTRQGDSPAVTQRTAESTGIMSATPDTSRASELRAAQELYDYGKERTPVTVNDREFKGPYVPDDSVPRMWIASAKLKANVKQPATRIIARIRSERAYPPMGIVAGYNYVWRNSWEKRTASRWVTKILPDDKSVTEHQLLRDARKHEYTHGMSPIEPRLVRIKVHSMGIGLCLDDPVCPTGHCGYY